MRLRAILPCLVALSLPAAARADATPDAATLQAQLRSWFANLLAPAITLPEPKLEITRQGDRFHAVLPLRHMLGPDAGEITAELRPLDAGRWAVEQLRMPASSSFAVPDPTGTKASGPTGITVTFGSQTSHAVIDPALASPTTFDVQARDIVTRSSGGDEQMEQRIAQYALKGSLAPSTEGRLDLRQDATLADLRAVSRGKDGTMVGFAVGRMQGNGQVEGLNRAQWDKAFAAFKQLLAETPSGSARKPDGAEADKAIRAAARALLLSLRDLFTRIEGRETLHDITVEVAGIGGGSLREAAFGLGGEAPDGKLHAWFDVAMEGIAVPDLPPNMAKYLPSRVALRPAISGVSMDRLYQLLTDAAADAPDQAKLQAQALALLSDGASAVGLESLSIVLSPLTVEGTGRVRLVAPDKPGIEAHLSATGMDALVAEAGKDPTLQRAMPFLVMARGLGKAQGDRLVWDISVTPDAALVNGVDVKQMGQTQSPAKPQQKWPERR